MPRHLPLRPLLLALSLAYSGAAWSAGPAAPGDVADAADAVMPVVTVTGQQEDSYAARNTKSAGRLGRPGGAGIGQRQRQQQGAQGKVTGHAETPLKVGIKRNGNDYHF